ncbi:MAG: DeoR/GlpR family DNA-binding transcription regulator [Actinomycetota bacterium]|nr:DeoR/GlpR family DNA-binding transcription regulator [Actinomycetota bacterium]
MLSAERKLEIAKIINKDGRIKTSELSDMFNVSEMTVLRDLAVLEKEGVLKRVYGGALALNDSSHEIPSKFRDRIHTAEKDIIAAKATALVSKGDSLFLDGSTTCLALARRLKGIPDITVITNGLEIINELKGNPEIKVVSTGGELNMLTNSFYGVLAAGLLKDINLDFCFISAAGISLDAGVTEPNPYNIFIKRSIIKNSARAVLLMDSSKFGKVTLNRVCLMADINTIITDKKPQAGYIDLFKQHQIEVIF